MVMWWGGVLSFWANFMSTHTAGPLSHALILGSRLCLIFVCTGLMLMLTVMLFNWPKFIVPPPQRSEPGAVAEWRARRGRRRPGP